VGLDRLDRRRPDGEGTARIAAAPSPLKMKQPRRRTDGAAEAETGGGAPPPIPELNTSNRPQNCS
jgi:hypothetical protein